jgi:hypothetical protein
MEISRRISDEYCSLNTRLHQDHVKYGTSGGRNAPDVMHLALQYQTCDILDYGCGKAKLANNLPFQIKNYDPAIKKYADEPEPSNIVVCTDVLEHVEPDCLNEVLLHLKQLIKKVGLFVISTVPANKTLADGRNSHLIIKSFDWWKDRLKQYFEIELTQIRTSEFAVVVKPIQSQDKEM